MNTSNPTGHRLPFLRLLLALVLAVGLAGCATTSGGGGQKSGKSYVIKGKRYYILASADGYKEKGEASWYGEPFHGRKTANGETYDMNQVSAAHKTLPLGTWVEVKNLSNNKTLNVRVNDRGPFIDGRIIDLSKNAANRLGVIGPGVAPVLVTAIPADRARRLAAAGGGAPAPRNAAPKAPAPKPAQQSAQVKKGPYRLQVSSTTDPAQAEKIAQRLRSEFSPVSMKSAHQDGDIHFYIYIEGLPNQKAAKDLQNSLTERGYRNVKLITV